MELGEISLAEYVDFAARGEVMVKEIEQLREQTLGTLGGFYTVEAFAEDWPEGYTFFPHPTLAPTTLPVMRIADLNARIAAAREAA